MQKPFQTNPWELEHLLGSIDKGQIVVPEFQRSFVWDPKDTFDLIISIANGYPAGSLLFIRNGKSNVLDSRKIEGVDTESRSLLQPEQLVLDGQQRLTSLYQALYGKGRHRFFIDLRKLKEGEELEDALHYEKVEHTGNYNKRETQFEGQILPLTRVFGKETNFDEWMFEFIEYRVNTHGEDRKELQIWLSQFKEKYLKPMQKYEFPVIELSELTSLEAICRIFETLNLKGVKLTVFEILTAKLFSRVKLRDLWQVAREQHPLLSQFIDEDESVYVLKTIALLKHGDSETQAISCKRSALLELTARDVETHWDAAVDSLNKTLIIMKNEYGIISKKWLPYVTILPPLAAIFSLSQSNARGPSRGDARMTVDRWFWCSVFSQRYDSGTDTKSVTDVSEVLSWIAGGEEPTVVKNFRFDTNDLRSISEQRNAVYRALISLIVRNGALDFHKFSKISTLDLQEAGIEDHHVFPYQYLTDNRFKGESTKNCILNKTLIDASTNSSIGKRSPSSYLQDIRADRVEAILNSHLLIEGLDPPLLRDKFEDFLGQRQEIFAKLIAGMTGSVCDSLEKTVRSPTYSPEFEEPSVDDEESPFDASSGNLADQLTRSTGDHFERIGMTSIYKSATKTVSARWSQRYRRGGHTYWYRLSSGDLASVTKEALTHFAYVCADSGTVLIPVKEMEIRLREDKLNGTIKEGVLQHYHIHFLESSAGLEWLMRHGSRENIQNLFYPMK